MSRYIDADEAVTMIALQMPFIIQGFEDNKRTAQRIIGSMPSIEIVRCKECIFADCDDKAEMYRCCSVSFPHWNKGEHFCADGERREP